MSSILLWLGKIPVLLTGMFNLSCQTVLTKTSVKIYLENLLEDIAFSHQKP